MGRIGADAGEIMGHRAVWGVLLAAGLVWLAGQSDQVRRVLRNPRTLMWLTLSTALIAVNWFIFVWAVNSGRTLETSLGYYLNPLFNMALGAWLFRERISGWVMWPSPWRPWGWCCRVWPSAACPMCRWPWPCRSPPTESSANGCRRTPRQACWWNA
ncbi:EamA family transporter [Brevundimonas denitrificans]|uniref:EamA family transporter n=1 Tax=Brevundimonas denitrificans TaxID=1443434 RepID=UPI00352FDAF7